MLRSVQNDAAFPSMARITQHPRARIWLGSDFHPFHRSAAESVAAHIDFPVLFAGQVVPEKMVRRSE